ncbi:methyltransferase domain-containing protein [candidate division WOR-3 bacterium]|nr:methyltransferase domain-containing protein [candidate division WOR-3 bacterium]
MAKYLPGLLKKFRAKPKTLLDIACGDGRFTNIMAKKGIEVTGLDCSIHMLKYAKMRAKKTGVKIDFIHQKMQNLSVNKKFDLVTCWFDSLNYLLTKRELIRTFRNISKVLNKNGLFIFDMNTIYGLSVIWQDNSPCVIQNADKLFEVHICPPIFKRNIATLKIIGFMKRGKSWQRINEIHRQRGYTLKDIRECLRKAHLKELASWGNIRTMSKPKRSSGEVWFIARRKK